MKALSKKQLISLLSMIVLSLLVGISPALYQKAKASNRLSAEQIAALRTEEKYRLYTNGEFYLPMTSMIIPTLDEVIEVGDTFVYAEVVEETTYTRNVLTGITALDEKRASKGISGNIDYYAYTMEVIDDTEGLFQPGEEILVEGNMEYRDYDPQFDIGMKVLIPILVAPHDPDRTSSIGIGTYYVTEDGYALSAFEESQENMQGRSAYTGLPVEQLLYQLKKR